MPRIRRISIQNFRSIKKVELEVPDFTVFVGDNDCGKSNILRALNLFFNGETNPGEPFSFRDDYNKYVIPKAKKARQIEIELDLELPASYRENNGQFIRWKKVLRADGLQDGRAYNGFNLVSWRGVSKIKLLEDGISDRSNAHSLLQKIEFEYVPAVRSAVFFRNLRGRIYEVIAEAAEQGMRATSSDFEAAISGYVESLISDITEQLGDDARISMPNDLSAIFERLDFLYSDHAISLDNRGDGIKARYIPLILKFIADQKRSLQVRGSAAHTFIWAYEEPENNLEFRRARELAENFSALAADDFTQVFLTTHSPIFYNLAESGDADCVAVHVSCMKPELGTRAAQAKDDELGLDEKMGVMPIIAPYISKAQKELDELRDHSEQLADKVAELNPDNKPAIFFEGPTDYKLFSELLKRFRPAFANRVFLSEPPTRAGAHYVTNMLRAWEYQSRHQSMEKRANALGILDNDAEGQRAKQSFDDDVSPQKYSNTLLLPTPAHLKSAEELGFKPAICLESLWSPEIWHIGDAKGWLTGQSEITALLSDALIEQLIESGDSLEAIFESDQLIYVRNQPTNNQKSNWLSHMLEYEDAKLETDAYEFLEVLDEAISTLLP